MQKKCPLYEFPSLTIPTNTRQPMHSLSALTELPSPNLAPFLLLDPVYVCVSVRDLPPLPISEFFSSVFLKRRLQSITTREERNVQAGPGRRDGRAGGRRRRLPTRGGSFFLPCPAPPPPDIPIDRERCEVCLDTGRRIDEDPGRRDGRELRRRGCSQPGPSRSTLAPCLSLGQPRSVDWRR